MIVIWLHQYIKLSDPQLLTAVKTRSTSMNDLRAGTVISTMLPVRAVQRTKLQLKKRPRSEIPIRLIRDIARNVCIRILGEYLDELRRRLPLSQSIRTERPTASPRLFVQSTVVERCFSKAELPWVSGYDSATHKGNLWI